MENRVIKTDAPRIGSPVFIPVAGNSSSSMPIDAQSALRSFEFAIGVLAVNPFFKRQFLCRDKVKDRTNTDRQYRGSNKRAHANVHHTFLFKIANDSMVDLPVAAMNGTNMIVES